MLPNENAGELEPSGNTTQPTANAAQLNLPATLDQVGLCNPADRRGGAFLLSGCVIAVTEVGKFGRPITARVLRIDLSCKPVHCPLNPSNGVPVVVGGWRVFGFFLN